MLLGVAAFAISVAVYMPARFAAQKLGVPAGLVTISGSIWNGSAGFDGDHTVAWETSAWESLRRMTAVVNWRLTGPGTDLTGRVSVPLPPRIDRAVLDAVDGNVGWPLVEAAMPGLTIRCEARAKITGLRVSLEQGVRSGEGSFAAPEGNCSRIDGAVPPVPTPALAADLSFDAEGLVAVLAKADVPQAPLVTARLTNADRIIVTIHAEGAALVPGMPASADSEIDLPLIAVFR